ncbi:MAG: S-methyl-5-thioribose-1-phosphate isomerase, partial [Candidatus Eiseniibacteriota bacterium]
MMIIPTITWTDGRVRILDQTLLPDEERYIDTTRWQDVARAIERLAIRGAPAIGVAAAMGVALAAHEAARGPEPVAAIRRALDGLAVTRPTAVNLFWALGRQRAILDRRAEATVGDLVRALTDEARRIYEEDLELSRSMGRHGADLLPEEARVITICNTGGLATAGLGTALAVVYAAHEAGKRVHVFACETRPLLQGARLTTWELRRAGIPVTLIVDSAAASALRRESLDMALAGADRIVANGDTANKVGTYPLAVLAGRHEVPFVVVAPTTTIDLGTPDGDRIPIEERGADEVTAPRGHPMAPPGVEAWNPA